MTLQNNSAVPRKLVTIPKLFCYAILSKIVLLCNFIQNCFAMQFRGGGGSDLERGYGDVWPWRPPFHASPAARRGPISSKRVSSQDPLLRKFGNFSLNSLNFHPNFSSQAPKFGNFQLTSPLFRGKCQFASPTLQKSGPHTPTWKKVECPPPDAILSKIVLLCNFTQIHFCSFIWCVMWSILICYHRWSLQVNKSSILAQGSRHFLFKGGSPPKKKPCDPYCNDTNFTIHDRLGQGDTQGRSQPHM